MSDERKPFDLYAAGLATGITGPFVLWGMYVVMPRIWMAVVGSVLFLSFVFWAFGRVQIK